MSTESTIYDVQVRYMLRDQASAGLMSLGSAADSASRSTDILSGTLGKLGAFLGAGYLFHKGKEAFIDFNSSMQQLGISTAAQLEANGLAKTFDEATVSAHSMVEEYKQFSKLTPVTTKDIAEFSAATITEVARAGGALKDITNVAEQGVIAAKVFGAESHYASMEISEMLSRGVTARMRFAKQLLSAAHIDRDAFNQMTGSGKLQALEKALNSPAMKESLEAFRNSFEGVLSTFKDTLQLTMGEIGLPLFRAVTAEIKSWSEWLDKNPEKVAEISKDIAAGLTDGFHMMKDAVSFIIDHKEALLAIGKMWVIGRVAGGIGGLLGGVAGGMGGAGMLGIAGAAAEGTTALASFAAGFQPTIIALAAFKLALETGAEYLDEHHKRSVERDGDLMAFKDLIKSGREFDIMSKAKQLGILREDKGGQPEMLTGRALRNRLMDMGLLEINDLLKAEATLARAYADLNVGNALQKMLHPWLGGQSRSDFNVQEDPNRKPSDKSLKGGNTNVTIQHIEVASDDPDRFVIGMVRSFEAINKGRVSPREAIRVR